MCCEETKKTYAGELDFPALFKGDRFKGVLFTPENVPITRYKEAVFKLKNIFTQEKVLHLECEITATSIHVPEFDTSNFFPSTHIYELLVTDQDDDAQVLFFGKFPIKGNIQ